MYNVHTHTCTHKLLLSHWTDPVYFLRRKLATWDGAPRRSHYWGLGESPFQLEKVEGNGVGQKLAFLLGPEAQTLRLR